MTDVQDANATTEPSMEEILASIRRIIADEKDTPADVVAEAETPAKEDVLELTQMVQDDGSVVNVKDDPMPVFEPVAAAPEPAYVAPPPPPPIPPVLEKQDADALLSSMATSAATSSLAALASTVQMERKASFPGFTPLGDGAKSLEDIVMDLMRPMLKDWLDSNLPPIVERIVQKEVERIARRVQE